MICLLCGLDQGSHGNWQSQQPSSTGAMNQKAHILANTAYQPSARAEHAFGCDAHISMALYRFQMLLGVLASD